ncbi:MAG: aldose epimerase family protein [Tepidisphaeraceae bacterium]
MASTQQIESFGKTHDGKDATRFKLTNDRGAWVEITSLGATVLRLQVPDRAGKPGDVLLTPASVAAMEAKSSPYFGAICGRVANRIAGGKFTLDGKSYQLNNNEKGITHLHGGNVGYDRRIWSSHDHFSPDGPSILFKLTDANGTEAYPGAVHVEVRYTLTNANALRIDYVATTDAPTPINLTNHAYFNLKDAGQTDVLGHELRLFASRYTPVNEKLIPTGEVAPVAGSLLDFTRGRQIGDGEMPVDGAVKGYDHNYVVDGTAGTFRAMADVFEPTTGRAMELLSTTPAVQLYTGNYLDGSLTSPVTKAPYNQHAGFCLETQHYPDSVNHPAFPSTILRPGQTYRQTTEYRFSTR